MFTPEYGYFFSSFSFGIEINNLSKALGEVLTFFDPSVDSLAIILSAIFFFFTPEFRSEFFLPDMLIGSNLFYSFPGTSK